MILAKAKNLQGKEIRIEGNNCVYNNSNPDLKTEVGQYSKVTYYNSAVYLDESRHYLYFYGLTTNSGTNNFSVYVDDQLLWTTAYTLGTGTCCFNTYQRFSAGVSWPSFQTFIMTTTVGGCTGIADYTGVVKAFTDRNECYAYMTSTVDPGAKVKVNYMIPEGDYSYCKLTYKADYQPENQNDGTSIDISPTASSVNVEGLDENQLYYFTLFTDKSESEPFPFTATPDPIPPQYREKCDAIASDVVYGHKFTELELWLRYESNIPQFKCDYISGSRMSYFGNYIDQTTTRSIYFSNGIARVDYNTSTNEMTVTGFTGNPIGFYADGWSASPSDYRYGNCALRLVYNTWSTSYAIWTNDNYLIGENETISYTTSFNSIGDCIDYLYSNFRHVDLYVDNELWFKAAQ